MYFISADLLVTIGENKCKSYMELFPFFILMLRNQCPMHINFTFIFCVVSSLLASFHRPTTQSQLPFFRVKILGDSITRFLMLNLNSDWFVPEVLTKPGCTTSWLHQILRDSSSSDENCSVHVVMKNFDYLEYVSTFDILKSTVFSELI